LLSGWLGVALITASCLLPVDEVLNPAPRPSDGGGPVAGAGGGGSAGTGGLGGSIAVVCEPGSRVGAIEGSSSELTPLGTSYVVRTPPGYDATVAHPLITVYAPAGVTDPTQNEGFTQLTAAAGARGYVIAYLENVSPNDTDGVYDVALVPERIAASWCIDPARTYLTGHSNGGTMTTLMAVYSLTNPRPAAIAPSAAGIGQTMFLSQVACPAEVPAAMVLHSVNDALFPVPEFGESAAIWWAGCAGCGSVEASDSNGCAVYEGCPASSEVRYCEGSGAHGAWPPLNEAMLDFFERFSLPPRPRDTNAMR
jgi:polyhydroxybutyrate depolymerase